MSYKTFSGPSNMTVVVLDRSSISNIKSLHTHFLNIACCSGAFICMHYSSNTLPSLKSKTMISVAIKSEIFLKLKHRAYLHDCWRNNKKNHDGRMNFPDNWAKFFLWLRFLILKRLRLLVASFQIWLPLFCSLELLDTLLQQGKWLRFSLENKKWSYH